MKQHLAASLPQPLKTTSPRPAACRLTLVCRAHQGRTDGTVPTLAGPALYAELTRRRRRAQIAARHLLDQAEGCG